MNPFRPSLFYSQAQKYLNISGKVFYQNKAKHHLSRISWGMRTYWSSRKRFVLIQVLKSPHHHCLIFMKYIIDIYTNIEMRGSVTVRPPWLLIQIKGWNVSKLIKLIKLLKGLRPPTATLRSAADVSEPTFQRFSYKLSGFRLQI